MLLFRDWSVPVKRDCSASNNDTFCKVMWPISSLAVWKEFFFSLFVFLFCYDLFLFDFLNDGDIWIFDSNNRKKPKMFWLKIGDRCSEGANSQEFFWLDCRDCADWAAQVAPDSMDGVPSLIFFTSIKVVMLRFMSRCY